MDPFVTTETPTFAELLCRLGLSMHEFSFWNMEMLGAKISPAGSEKSHPHHPSSYTRDILVDVNKL